MRAIAASFAILIALSGPAGAQDLAEALAGSEVRRSQMFGDDQVRFDVWRFAADGTFTGAFSIEHGSARGGGYSEDGPSAGRWRADGGRLCLVEERGPRGGETCFELKRTGAGGGYIEFRGTETGSGLPWMFQVSPGG
jgi:hypothetical protein